MSHLLARDVTGAALQTCTLLRPKKKKKKAAREAGSLAECFCSGKRGKRVAVWLRPLSERRGSGVISTGGGGAERGSESLNLATVTTND